jgi:hypothetical protein
MIEKLCLFCKEFYLDNGHPDWSDITPGEDASMGCTKGIVYIDLTIDSLASYRKNISTAKNCLFYEQIETEATQ